MQKETQVGRVKIIPIIDSCFWTNTMDQLFKGAVGKGIYNKV